MFTELFTVVSIIRVLGFYHFTISFFALHLPVSEIAKWVCLLLFYKSYIIYYNIYHNYFGVFIEEHNIIYIKFRLD